MNFQRQEIAELIVVLLTAFLFLKGFVKGAWLKYRRRTMNRVYDSAFCYDCRRRTVTYNNACGECGNRLF